MLKSFVLPELNLAFNQKQCPDLLGVKGAQAVRQV